MTPEAQRPEVVRYWWAQAEESLAALLERQRSFRKHSGVRAAFHRDFIRTQLLDVEWRKFYDRLFEDRQEGDSIALVSFDQSRSSLEPLAKLSSMGNRVGE